VLLDDEEFTMGPGDLLRVVSSGAHQLVVTKPLFVTTTRGVSLLARRLETA